MPNRARPWGGVEILVDRRAYARDWVAASRLLDPRWLRLGQMVSETAGMS